jgi:hypothetical protein
VIWSRVSTWPRKCQTNGECMKVFKSFLLLGLVFLMSVSSLAEDRFPTGPNPQMTPGKLCENSPVRRYPEGIVYCERNVDTSLKRDIIRQYDEDLGFHIREMNRMDFKIDHFIPLSIGGSNSRENLWPQHKSVYTLTDPIEHELHAKMEQSKITQAEAIRVIKEAKLNLGRAPELLEYVQGL